MRVSWFSDVGRLRLKQGNAAPPAMLRAHPVMLHTPPAMPHIPLPCGAPPPSCCA